MIVSIVVRGPVALKRSRPSVIAVLCTLTPRRADARRRLCGTVTANVWSAGAFRPAVTMNASAGAPPPTRISEMRKIRGAAPIVHVGADPAMAASGSRAVTRTLKVPVRDARPVIRPVAPSSLSPGGRPVAS